MVFTIPINNNQKIYLKIYIDIILLLVYTLYKSSVMDSIFRKKPTLMRKRKLLSKYLTYEQAKNYISNFNFKTMLDYRNYIKSNGIDFLPLEPRNSYYILNFKTWEFLGLDEAIYKSNLLEQRRLLAFDMRSKRTPESNKKIGETRKKNLLIKRANSNISAPVTITTPIVKGLDPDKVISFLMQEDVEPETIVKMIANMNISSGTLMAELCKYMTKKNFEKQATWRPTGYTTAEAQMTTKI